MPATRTAITLLQSLLKRSLRLQATNLLLTPTSPTSVNILNVSRFYSSVPNPQKEIIRLTLILRDGEKKEIEAHVGKNLLDTIIDNQMDIPGFGACEATLACSTCHIIFTEETFGKLPTKPSEEEYDMLDLAFEVTDTSRLGCQLIVTKQMEGFEIVLPKSVNDARKDKS